MHFSYQAEKKVDWLRWNTMPDTTIWGGGGGGGGGRFKNTYELLNLRALKISMLYKNHINVWVRYFVWNFKRYLWNSTQNILPIHWKM